MISIEASFPLVEIRQYFWPKNNSSSNAYPNKHQAEFPFLKEVDSLVFYNSQLDLNSTYNIFFRKIEKGNKMQGFPKYKSNKNRQTFRTNNQKN
ncbi:hypothetical protein [Borreliella valaisiana]|uniref:hypothetical protein n=1 Tax=Borreliella valaisiana TaxID=62088 RepID=UPI001AED5C9B|nr:hypothetical protein [Borreliella valaisiana]